jgi:hypothetical protein
MGKPVCLLGNLLIKQPHSINVIRSNKTVNTYHTQKLTLVSCRDMTATMIIHRHGDATGVETAAGAIDRVVGT